MKELFALAASLIVGLYLVLTGPVYNGFLATDNCINDHVKVVTNNYQKEIRNCGYIDLETYNKYINEISKTKRLYNIQLVHTNILIYPNGPDDFKPLKIEYGNEQILNTIYSGHKYYLKYGDEIKVIATQRQKDDSRVLINSLRGSMNDIPYITVNYGGMVNNEAN